MIRLLFALCLCIPSWAADKPSEKHPLDVEPLEDAPPLVRSAPSVGSSVALPAETNLLEMFVFLDTAFSVGRSLSQGFEISSARFGARGDVVPFADYRVVAGQTREFSSAQLPQLTLVEAWVRAHDGKHAGGPPSFAWKAGMYTPSINPWWSPDLVDLPLLPDYAKNHRALLPNRDLGSEILVRPFTGVELVVGIFNGSGITVLNTNNSRGFNGMLRGRLDWENAFLEVGVGGYLQQQADVGSVNYINNAAGSLFMSIGSLKENWWVAVDLTSGRLEDVTGSDAALGAALSAQFRLTDNLHLFSRGEVLRLTPDSGQNLERIQAGPVVSANEWLRAFLLFEYLRNAAGSESAGEIRIRLTL